MNLTLVNSSKKESVHLKITSVSNSSLIESNPQKRYNHIKKIRTKIKKIYNSLYTKGTVQKIPSSVAQAIPVTPHLVSSQKRRVKVPQRSQDSPKIRYKKWWNFSRVLKLWSITTNTWLSRINKTMRATLLNSIRCLYHLMFLKTSVAEQVREATILVMSSSLITFWNSIAHTLFPQDRSRPRIMKLTTISQIRFQSIEKRSFFIWKINIVVVSLS